MIKRKEGTKKKNSDLFYIQHLTIILLVIGLQPGWGRMVLVGTSCSVGIGYQVTSMENTRTGKKLLLKKNKIGQVVSVIYFIQECGGGDGAQDKQLW